MENDNNFGSQSKKQPDSYQLTNKDKFIDFMYELLYSVYRVTTETTLSVYDYFVTDYSPEQLERLDCRVNREELKQCQDDISSLLEETNQDYQYSQQPKVNKDKLLLLLSWIGNMIIAPMHFIAEDHPIWRILWVVPPPYLFRLYIVTCLTGLWIIYLVRFAYFLLVLLNLDPIPKKKRRNEGPLFSETFKNVEKRAKWTRKKILDIAKGGSLDLNEIETNIDPVFLIIKTYIVVREFKKILPDSTSVVQDKKKSSTFRKIKNFSKKQISKIRKNIKSEPFWIGVGGFLLVMIESSAVKPQVPMKTGFERYQDAQLLRSNTPIHERVENSTVHEKLEKPNQTEKNKSIKRKGVRRLKKNIPLADRTRNFSDLLIEEGANFDSDFAETQKSIVPRSSVGKQSIH